MKTDIFLLFLLCIFITTSSFAENELSDLCTDQNSKDRVININKDLHFCYGPKGLTIVHFENTHNFKFINHIESQFYLIKTLPTGFRCRCTVCRCWIRQFIRSTSP